MNEQNLGGPTAKQTKEPGTGDETQLFLTHLDDVTDRWQEAMAFSGFDAVIILAGEARNHFLDDQAPPLKINPHFLQWCPSETAAGSALLIRPGERPGLFFLRPDDYWHQPPEVPHWADTFETQAFAERTDLYEAVRSAALRAGNHIALIGEVAPDADQEMLANIQVGQDLNPALLLNHLHFNRAMKTDFELASMAIATHKAVEGHLAAARAFESGQSEFQINLEYLSASGQLPAELPYQSIVALNEHAGVLHYQHYDRTPPTNRNSFLIDAGGSHNGYAADITRTYSGGDGLFSELLGRLDAAQQALIASMTVNTPYLELHIGMHRRLAEILHESGLITCTAEEAFDTGLTETFLPHGLGHLIGLQTHDVAGQQSAPEGGITAPPENYSALRLTRTLTDKMPVTIEPGLYFIPQLLEAVRAGDARQRLNWPAIDALLPFGGIRIEDNVYLRDGQLVNLTRDAFAQRR